MLWQQHYDVTDQLLILNHALMVFGLLNDKRTALPLPDIDEYLNELKNEYPNELKKASPAPAPPIL